MPDSLAQDGERTRSVDALIVGGGPAGLMAADVLGGAGRSILLAEAKPTVGRKFLMAGKSGLNLTFDVPATQLVDVYGPAAVRLRPMVEAFDADAIRAWARDLGQETFTGSSGRVFPVAMKASPLLRAWLARLDGLGVELRTRWRWHGWEGDLHRFATPEGDIAIRARVAILALGGASWARLGSDGAWVGAVAARGATVAPFRPSNAGLSVAWSPEMARHHGSPVKGAALSAGDLRTRGEFVISHRGLEGGGLYAVFAAVRDGAALQADLLPDLSQDEIAARLARASPRDSRTNRLRKALRLDPARLALLNEFGRPLPPDAALPALLKALPIRHAGPRPLDEAISTAGGLTWDSLDDDLMLSAAPGVFAAGEMIDWEAPTGGYLLTACLATGRWAGRAAARRLATA
ncbi:TIGR03862 family flavoprotein [Palleronia sp. KMU-117]|uniref:TIGR03862 family flavoprotein n=1 Tax=Palleronia sp. KMU-117 TaxID=3434108 RepID=UPI003D7479B0